MSLILYLLFRSQLLSQANTNGKKKGKDNNNNNNSQGTRAQGHCEPGLISQGWGTLPGGRVVVGGPGCASTAQRPGPKTASPGSDNSHLLGASRLFFAVVVTGRRGLRVCCLLGQLLAPRPHVSEPPGGTGPLIAGCRCPAGVKGWRGHSPGDRERLGPERVPGKIPSPAPVAPGASKGSCHGAWSCSPGPGFAAGECLLRTPRKGGRLCLHGEGGWSSGGLRSQRSQSLLA